MASVQDLILLGLLMERPLHGYEIKQLIAAQMASIAKVSPGTIYYTLKKLDKKGLITSSSERNGNRPERRVFSLTDAGRATFAELLSESLTVDERPYDIFDVSLFFAKHIDLEELLVAVERKLQGVHDLKELIVNLERDNPGRWPFNLDVIRRKGHILTDAYAQWFIDLRDTVKNRIARRSGSNDSPNTNITRSYSP